MIYIIPCCSRCLCVLVARFRARKVNGKVLAQGWGNFNVDLPTVVKALPFPLSHHANSSLQGRDHDYHQALPAWGYLRSPRAQLSFEVGKRDGYRPL